MQLHRYQLYKYLIVYKKSTAHCLVTRRGNIVFIEYSRTGILY